MRYNIDATEILTAIGLVALPILVTLVLMQVIKKTRFGQMKNSLKQLIIGTIFGAVAVMCSEFGFNFGDAIINTRDAAVLSAGVVFGGPAGIIAGLIGGIERWFAVYWGAAEYSRIACCVATIACGFISDYIKKIFVKDTIMSPLYGTILGAMMESFHMLLLFITHMDDASKVFGIVFDLCLPMIILTAISVGGVCGVAKMFNGEEAKKDTGVSLSRVYAKTLLITMLVGAFISFTFTDMFEHNIAMEQLEITYKRAISDVESKIDFEDSVTFSMDALNDTFTIWNEFDDPSISDEMRLHDLKQICKIRQYTDAYLYDADGNIYMSTKEECVGRNIYEEAKKKGCYEELARADNFMSKPLFSYAGNESYYYVNNIPGQDTCLFEVTAEKKKALTNIAVMSIVTSSHIGKDGFLEMLNVVPNGTDTPFAYIYSTGSKHETEDYETTEEDYEESDAEAEFDKGQYLYNLTKEHDEYEIFEMEYDGEEYFAMYAELAIDANTMIYGFYPKAEAYYYSYLSEYLQLFMNTFIFTMIFIAIFSFTKKKVINNIYTINNSLKRITDGDLDETVNVKATQEFSDLSLHINDTVGALKGYIDREAKKNEEELNTAREIQLSCLPSLFPPYAGRFDFDIYATMRPAKEVGGDFYDLYLVDDNNLAVVMADVSGKGIPAALFMMTAKAMLKNHAQAGHSVDEIFRRVNNLLCENNKAGMFVTAWMGILNLKTGVVTFANAGHEMPIILKKDGTAVYHKSPANLVLAAMEDMQYKAQQFTLEPGESIFLYTDGITEATNKNNELYGEDRLIKRMNDISKTDSKEVCKAIIEDVDKFDGDAPQFDDITVLCVKYVGQ